MRKLILALAVCCGLTAYGCNEAKNENIAKVTQAQPQKTRNHVDLDISIQRTAHRQFLRQDADRTKMAERDCRLSFCGHRNILLHNNVFISNKEEKYGNKSFGNRLRQMQGNLSDHRESDK